MPTFIKTGYWEKAVKNYKGWLNLEDLISNVIPSQAGNAGKFLTTNGSTLSWADVLSSNIYTANGTLTGNRVVTLDNKQLVFRTNPSVLQNYTFTIGTPTGVTPSTLPVNIVNEGEYLISSSNANPFVTRVWARNQSTSQRFTTINSVFADITAESTGAGRITNQRFETYRGSSLDASTSTSNTITGISNTLGHSYQLGFGATTNSIYTHQVTGIINSISSLVGSIGTAWGNYSSLNVSSFTTYQNSTVTNYYAYYSTATIGANSGPIGTVTNYYGIYFETPAIRATGVITNRWGVYAPDASMRHYINGKLLIGTTTAGTSNVRISGLPTSSAGLVSGELWNNGGVVNIVP